MNDNHNREPPLPVNTDSHGQAALLLTEAMLHALVEARVLTTAEALSVVETAAEVKMDLSEAGAETTASMDRSLQLLGAIAYSLRGGD